MAIEMSDITGPSCMDAASSQVTSCSYMEERLCTLDSMSSKVLGHGVSTNWRNFTVWMNRLAPALDSLLWRLQVANRMGAICWWW